MYVRILQKRTHRKKTQGRTLKVEKAYAFQRLYRICAYASYTSVRCSTPKTEKAYAHIVCDEYAYGVCT